MTMNERALALFGTMATQPEEYRVALHNIGGAQVLDCGAAMRGSLAAGLALARITMGGLGQIELVATSDGPAIQVTTDHPTQACLASQYAGRQVAVGKYFGMGSGPMRAVIVGEEIFADIGCQEVSPVAVGVIESRKLPTEEVIESLLAKLPPTTKRLVLLVAPASSLAGNIQVVARSVETAMHKLHELKFDVKKVLSGFGIAPLPPVVPNEIAAIGRTNDAILYGGQVTLVVDAEDAEIEAIGPKVPSSASADHGALFAELFARYGDFYKIDPMLFSPAEVTFQNLRTGRSFRYGSTTPDLWKRSFAEVPK
ncbi:MAG: methenyltetrahydromethanopterin cyclohydrolase [Fimbriiglobus sp.]